MRVDKLILAPLFVVFLSACAPEIGSSLAVVELPDSRIQIGDNSTSARVKVGRFEDARSDETIVNIVDQRRVPVKGSVTGVVEEGFKRYLREVGARVVVLDAPTIEGEVTQWVAQVKPGFPTSEGESLAQLKVTVRDSHGHPIYFATFSGQSKTERPFIGSDEVQSLLGESMGSAIEAAVKDRQFISHLAKGRIN